MNTRTRRASTPAYYLGRPAALWLTVLTPRPTDRPALRVPCTAKAGGPAPAHA